MAPRTGRPKTENPRYNRITVSLTDEDMELAEKAREKDKEQERTLATWLARKISEWLRKPPKK